MAAITQRNCTTNWRRDREQKTTARNTAPATAATQSLTAKLKP
jgi:hypothetical protein